MATVEQLQEMMTRARMHENADKFALMPDTTKALGSDVFETFRFKCEDPSSDLIVRAYPLRYINNIRLKKEFTRQMRFGDVDLHEMSVESGVIENNEVQ